MPRPVSLRNVFSSAPTNARAARRLRMALALAALALLACIGLTASRAVGVGLGGQAFVSVQHGCIRAGMQQPNPVFATKSGAFVEHAWNADWALAWRPFRVVESFPGPPTSSIVVPLWPGLLVCVLGAGLMHGKLTATRDARSTSCSACGYDIRSAPTVNGRVTCPECGLRRSTLSLDHPVQPTPTPAPQQS